MDSMPFNSSQRHISYKIIQQLTDKLFSLESLLSRHNIFAPCKKTPIDIGKKTLQQTIIFPTRTILHPRLDVITIRDFQDIPKTVYNRIQAKKTIQRHPIGMTDANYDYILDEIERREKLSLNGM